MRSTFSIGAPMAQLPSLKQRNLQPSQNESLAFSGISNDSFHKTQAKPRFGNSEEAKRKANEAVGKFTDSRVKSLFEEELLRDEIFKDNHPIIVAQLEKFSTENPGMSYGSALDALDEINNLLATTAKFKMDVFGN